MQCSLEVGWRYDEESMQAASTVQAKGDKLWLNVKMLLGVLRGVHRQLSKSSSVLYPYSKLLTIIIRDLLF